jgi:UDP-glucose 4-epimerase
MNTVILRFFNIYGPGQRNTYAGVIQKFIDRVLRSISPIIYGSGQQIRDFLHVQDATEAIARSLAYEGESHTTFNIDSGKATEIIDLAKLIFRLAGGEELKPVRARARKGEIHMSLANIEKATKKLNFHPEVSLEIGIKQLLTSQELIQPMPSR